MCMRPWCGQIQLCKCLVAFAFLKHLPTRDEAIQGYMVGDIMIQFLAQIVHGSGTGFQFAKYNRSTQLSPSAALLCNGTFMYSSRFLILRMNRRRHPDRAQQVPEAADVRILRM